MPPLLKKNKLRLTFLFLVIINCFVSVYSQSKVFDKYINDKVETIDANIQDKLYVVALENIEDLEKNKSYIENDDNRLNLQLRRAKVLLGTGEEEKALDLLLQGLNDIDKIGLNKLKIEYSQYLGDIFKSDYNFSKADYYFKSALSYSIVEKDTLNILNSYLKIGANFYSQKELDSAINYYLKITEFPLSNNTSELISRAYNNLNVISLDNNDYDNAELYGSKALEIKRNEKDTLGMAVTLMNLGNVLYKKGQFEKVRDNYLSAFDQIRTLNSDKAIRFKENLLYNLAYVNEQLKDFEKAYKYLEQATVMTDSLAEATRIKSISEIEAKYNVSEQARRTEEEKSKKQRAQMLFYFMAFAFLTFIIVGYIYYRNYRLKQMTKLEQLENEAQTRIINATIDAKEMERKSIAQTLHDSVSALLSSANLHLQATKAQLKKDAPQEISKAQTIVNEASVKIRDLSHELISSVLLKFGLAFAVHDMCQKYSNSEISLHSDDDGIKRYDQDFEIKVYNIIEELVNNILKHSKATNATIMLSHRENDMLSIRISDDGVGFDIKKAKNKDGLGLSHINARIKVMKGVFNIVSSKGNGTSIFMLIPIKYKG
ncbi:MAG: hypothetical protein KDC74_04490 [Flavobacteriaceae bacterium]|nr:hypothetical protein [Flavobacteriaceae bacterium]